MPLGLVQELSVKSGAGKDGVLSFKARRKASRVRGMPGRVFFFYFTWGRIKEY